MSQAQSRVANAIQAVGTANQAVQDLQQMESAAEQRLLADQRRRYRFPETHGIAKLEALAENSVVDGLALLKLWQAGKLPLEKIDPNMTPNELAGLQAELHILEATVDAVGDALTVESVYQLVQGNLDRAAASLDTVTRGEVQPPELESARTPRRGSAIHQRLVVLLRGRAGGSEQAGTWAAAEARLQAWAAQILPPPAQVRCRADFLDPENGQVLRAGVGLSLNRLGLPVFDLVCLAAAGTAAGETDLERLVALDLLHKPPEGLPPGLALRLHNSREMGLPAGQFSLDEFLELAVTFYDLVASARPLQADDLAALGESVPAGTDAAELRARADQATADLQTAVKALADNLPAEPEGGFVEQELREALARLASFGIPGCVPVAPGAQAGMVLLGGAALLVLAQAALAEAQRRLEALDAIGAQPAEPEAIAARAIESLQTVFGPSFPVLPVFSLPRPNAFSRSLARQDELLGEDPDDTLALHTWLQRAGRVRPGAGRLDDLLLFTGLRNLQRTGALQVAQLPSQAGERWVGLPPQPGAHILPGRLSLVAHTPRPVNPNQPLAGLVVDEWVEEIPDAGQVAGVAFQYDAPGSRPPQAVLLAAAPGDRPDWDLETLEGTLLEAFDLARLRAVGTRILTERVELLHSLPALYFSLNLAGDTLSTDFKRLL
jgi:hypothetical protein